MSIGNNPTLPHVLKLWREAIDSIASILYDNMQISIGQGIVYNSLSFYFAKDRMKIDYIRKHIITNIILIKNLIFRKTSKSMKSPVRYHGWKGKR